MKHFLKISDRFDLKILVISLTILLYLSRTVIPFLKYPFILVYLSLIVYVIFAFNFKLFHKIKEFTHNYSLLLLLAIILIISFLFSNKLYLTIFVDVCNSLILLSLFFLLSLFVTTTNEFEAFKRIFLELLTIFALIISLNGLFSLFNIFSVGGGLFSKGISSDLTKEYISIDYNFGLLLVFFGMINIIFILVRTQSLTKIFLLDFLLLIYSINIIFSGSRRGIILLVLIFVLIAILQIFSLFKKNGFLKQLASGTRYYIISLIILSLFCWAFTSKASCALKNSALEFIGSKNLVATKAKIAIRFFKYSSVFDRTKTYSDIYNAIWSPGFGPLDPDSGWGGKIHKTIFPLVGENVEIVPNGAKGYLMDNTCNADTLNGYALSATWISNDTVDENKILEASVFCYVSKECDLSMVEICSLGAMGNPGTLYDLQNKGVWQKLAFNVNCSKGTASVLLYFSKLGAVDFSDLNGYVIFAYPSVKIIEKNDSVLSYLGKINEYNKMECLNNRIKGINNKKILFSPLDNVYKTVDFHLAKNLRDSFNIIHSDGESVIDISNENIYFRGSVFNLERRMLERLFVPVVPYNLIKKWASQLISEDTTYHGLSNRLIVDNISNNLIGPRTARWQFAWQIFEREYNWKQKVFGGGFNFLNWFGFYFLKNKTLSDYPHNPFLSILLYSGLVGLLLFIFLLYKVFFYYSKYFKEYYLFFIFFLITFFFSFFSGGSPFDPPVMGFFMILPFFINYINEVKEQV
jgi:hypothetical protein